ncbi:MAG TPA: SpoIIE family protein phosphatase [Victivallales bacterium]|nr:SpoIIE family protein phosphatase [Victivallales bacterium]
MLLNKRILLTFIITLVLLINISNELYSLDLFHNTNHAYRRSISSPNNYTRLAKGIKTNENYFSNSISFYKKLKINLLKLSDAEKKLDMKNINTALTNIQSLYTTIGNYKKAIEYNEKLKQFGKKYKNRNMIFNYYLNLSTIYYIQFNDVLSLENSFKALKYSSGDSDTWQVYDNIGAIYTDINDFKDGLFYSEAAEKIVNKLNDNGLKYYIQYVISNILLHQKKYKKSIEVISKAFNKLKSPAGYEYNLYYTSLAYAYFHLDDYDKALLYFIKNLKKCRNNSQVIKTLSYIGRVYVKKHNYTQARIYLEKAEKINDTTTKNDYDFMLINKGFYELYYAEKKYNEAFKYLLLYSKEEKKHYKRLLSVSTAILKNKYIKTQVPILKDEILYKNKKLGMYDMFNLLLIIISSLILIMLLLFFYLYFTNKKYAQNLKILNRNLEHEIRTAAEIQRSILPGLSNKFKRPEFTLCTKLMPARDAAGDFYDFFYLDDNRLALIIADVSDKGIAAAVFMSFAKTLLRNICPSEENPAMALNKANKILSANNIKCMFVTVFLSYYNIKTGDIIYANAGHHDAIVLNDNSDCSLGDISKFTKHFNKLSSCRSYNSFGNLNNIPLGIMENVTYKEGHKHLQIGESIISYTDGVTEAISPSEEEYGEKRLCDLIIKNKHLEPSKLLEKIIKEVIDFEEGNRFDDITIMIFKRNI